MSVSRDTIEELEDLVARYDLSGSIEKALADAKVGGSHPQPIVTDDLMGLLRYTENDDPLPPDDLTGLDLATLGRLFSFFQTWTNYVSAEATKAKITADLQAEVRSLVFSHLKLYYREVQGRAAADVADYITVDPNYIEYNTLSLQATAFANVLRDRVVDLKRVLNNISREQTRRGEEFGYALQDEAFGKSKPSKFAQTQGKKPAAPAPPGARRYSS